MSQPKTPPQRLADLRPNATTDCLVCHQIKPMAGAVRFRAYWVCAACAKKLQTAPQPTKATP